MSVAAAGLDARTDARPHLATVPAVEVHELHRSFGAVEALRGVSLEVDAGEIHGILGPNGAGKTSLMRILCGLVDPSDGSAYVLDQRAGRSRALRELIGFVPSGDRSFYLRLSGEENLLFFGRLQGLSKREARLRAREALADVGLADAGRRRVLAYSHGMQKRLSVARALLTEPPVLLVDEATHDLDPEAAVQVRELVRDLAANRTAVLWTTQRIEEIRGFADRVTFLAGGRVHFSGPVAELLTRATGRRFVLRVARRGGGPGEPALDALRAACAGRATMEPARDAGHLELELAEGVALGDVIAAVSGAGAVVLDCRRERSDVEDAFLTLAGRAAA
jgi:ABC-2 type transport system ATP-binding protein